MIKKTPSKKRMYANLKSTHSMYLLYKIVP